MPREETITAKSIRLHGPLAAFVLLIGAATAAAWLWSLETGTRHAGGALDEELAVHARAVESEIERFRYLPAVIGRDGRILAALRNRAPDPVAAANRYLTEVRVVSGADELYVMAPDGLTIAASNHAEPTSFVGHNYRFRPYFQDAMRHGAGRYYAVGVTTGQPGYFLSSAIHDDGNVVGVAIVKIDMAPIEAAWRNSSTLVALADGDGVIFLSGHAPWKYRPLRPLGETALAEIAMTRKYSGIDLVAAQPIFSGDMLATATLDGEGGEHLLRSRGIEPDGWRLIGGTPTAPIRANASLVTLLVALVGILLFGAAVYLRQRRQFIRAKLDENDRLERRVDERTAALNREVEERRRAETELRTAQATLIQTAKLAALGRMSAAIVHEVSQPLSALDNTLATSALLAERGDAHAVRERMGVARGLIDRMRRTVKHLRSFARNEPAATESVAIATSIAAAIELARHRADGEGVAISVAASPSLMVAANAVRIEQVILNLLVNALDAVNGRTRPRISIEAANAGGMVEIRVSDNGPGIAEETRERIAEPFFTTKQTGEGLGLGLSISRAIVTEFGGTLTFDSKEGRGSTFVISLPAAQIGDKTAPREAAE